MWPVSCPDGQASTYCRISVATTSTLPSQLLQPWPLLLFSLFVHSIPVLPSSSNMMLLGNPLPQHWLGSPTSVVLLSCSQSPDRHTLHICVNGPRHWVSQGSVRSITTSFFLPLDICRKSCRCTVSIIGGNTSFFTKSTHSFQYLAMLCTFMPSLHCAVILVVCSPFLINYGWSEYVCSSSTLSKVCWLILQ